MSKTSLISLSAPPTINISPSTPSTQQHHHPSPSPTSTTPWGCQIPIYPSSRAPRSLKLVHVAAPSTCRCRGSEPVIVKDYILRWVAWRIDELGEHPVKATTWARATCEYLGMEGALDGILGRIEGLYAGGGAGGGAGGTGEGVGKGRG